MSGICGIADFQASPISPQTLTAMASGGAQRAGWRTHHGSDFAMASGRAAPPLRSPDGRFWLVAEARLDNRADLLKALADRGLTPGPDPGDAELILSSHVAWGDAFADHLLGDFAVAVWDRWARRLLCARDPLGMRTFCWAQTGSRVCFASEARQILQHPGISRELNEATVADHLAGLPEAPERTIFRHVHRLAPGHLLVVEPAGARTARYWDLKPVSPAPRSAPECAEQLRETLERAVADRLRGASGAVAVMMSGGLDSCSVAALAQRNLPAGTHLFASSIVFENLRECDEREPIRTMRRSLGIDGIEVEAERHWFLRDPDIDRPGLETPFFSDDSLFRRLLEETRSRGASVLLTGYGGDDLLAGSRLIYLDRLLHGDVRALLEMLRYAASRRSLAGRVLWHYLVEPLLPSPVEDLVRRLTRRSPRPEPPDWIDPDLVRRTGLLDRWHTAPPRAWRAAASGEIRASLQALMNGDRALDWQNRVAATSGVEIRHPFLDRRLLELIAAIPPRFLFQAGRYKPLLRHAMTGLLPEVIRNRKDKTRQGAFMDLSLRERVSETIQDLLREPVSAELGFIDAGRLQSAYAKYRSLDQRPQDADRVLWYAFTLEFWLQRHQDPLELKPPVERNQK